MNGYSLEHFRFLVVDDNRHMTRLVGDVLRAFGAGQVTPANGGSEAIDLLKQQPFDLMVCDYQMEPMDGIQLANWVRTAQDSPNPFLHIIMLTGHTDMQHVMAARDSGVNEIVAKPFSPVALRERIISVIENPRDFVISRRYIGPDRRRRDQPELVTTERRRTPATVMSVTEKPQ